MAILAKKYFRDEAAAFAHLEGLLWPDGPICPHCGVIGKAGRLKGVKGKNDKVRPGLWKCYSKECRTQFTVKVGTVFECAHIPLNVMLQAVHLLCYSKKGFSAHQLSRILEVDYKSAWFLAHRIREAMRDGKLMPMGGRSGSRSEYKNMVVTLVERGGSARSFRTVASIVPIVRENIRRESRLMTDKALHYKAVGKEFAAHGAVEHKAHEYVRGDIHSNTVENYYSIFKRGMKGVYQHCKEKALAPCRV
jgi:transposase-like protein